MNSAGKSETPLITTIIRPHFSYSALSPICGLREDLPAEVVPHCLAAELIFQSSGKILAYPRLPLEVPAAIKVQLASSRSPIFLEVTDRRVREIEAMSPTVT